jgi:multiple sugar transport system permease protein
MKGRERLIKGLSYILLTAGSLFTIFPFLWMISTSLKEQEYILIFPPQWIPNPFDFQNYVEIWSDVPLASGFVNSTVVAVTGTFGVLLASSLAAFAFAKLDFPGKKWLFMMMLGTMMIPGAVLMIPQFILFKNLGWVNTLNPLIIPSFFGAIYETFFFRQFFRTIPDEFIDAAKIDGASFFQIYWRVILPQATPAVATLGILAFMWRWNDYMGPLIYLQDIDKQTLPVLISTFQSLYTTSYGKMMAVSVLSILPIITLFLFMQRYFVEGLAMTGLKG